MTGRFTAQMPTIGLHRRFDIPIADLRALKLQTGFKQRQFKPQIRHQCANHTCVVATGGESVHRNDVHQLVAIDNRAFLIRH